MDGAELIWLCAFFVAAVVSFACGIANMAAVDSVTKCTLRIDLIVAAHSVLCTIVLSFGTAVLCGLINIQGLNNFLSTVAVIQLFVAIH